MDGIREILSDLSIKGDGNFCGHLIEFTRLKEDAVENGKQVKNHPSFKPLAHVDCYGRISRFNG